MAAIAPERKLLAAAFLAVLCCVPARADRDSAIRDQLSSIATALSSGNASDAMSPFDKSFPAYQKLSDYFQALAAYRVGNEVNVTDQDDTDAETKLTVDWTLNLSDPNTRYSDSRTASVIVRFMLKRGKWKIVDFAPIELFNPLAKSAAGNRKP